MNITTEFCKFELVYALSFTLNWQFWFFGLNLPKKGISGRKHKKLTASLNSGYSNWARCHISRCYGTARPIKRKLTIYGTARPRGKFGNENAMALLCQSRESSPSMAPLGHVELTKMQKLLESKNKNKNENKNQNENQNEKSFLFSFSFLFFHFVFHFRFCYCLQFRFCFHFRFRFCFCCCFSFVFLVFILKFSYGTSRPSYMPTKEQFLNSVRHARGFIQTDFLFNLLIKFF